MATLVLSTVGTIFGGPIGGASGALLGQSVDARVFAPNGRAGPRLSDLRVQTSSYGTAVPRIHGTMRVAGTVIWATDLVERRTKAGGGKGRQSTTTYSYSASFAVAVSSRPILSVGRIWAEGNIFRGAAGDFKSPTGFRMYAGDEDQAVDPLIAAALGIGSAPAFRGIAYVVFEDMDLAPFGNRIPSMSFEIVADAAPITLAQPLSDILGAADVAGSQSQISGAALVAATRGEALAALLPLVSVARPPGLDIWRIGESATDTITPLPAVAGDKKGTRASRTVPSARQVPTQIALSSYDPARDHHIGQQSARVADGSGPVERLAVPLALNADRAKAIVARLARERGQRQRDVQWPTGFAALALAPGDRVTTPGSTRPLRISGRRIAGAGVMLMLEREQGVMLQAAADGGQSMLASDAIIGQTVGYIFDLPARDGNAIAANLVLAAAGTGAGWRSAAVAVRPTAGAAPADVGVVERAGAIGRVITVNAVSDPAISVLFDRMGSIIVELLRTDMTLTNADDAAMLAGANLAVIGGEVLQFGVAVPLSPGIWRLSQLLRGRRGTEDAMAAAGVGAAFALLDDPALLNVPSSFGFETVAAGGAIELNGIGDVAPVVVPVTTTGRALRPLSPVHLRSERGSDGGLVLRWIRRSRSGFSWSDGGDAPIDERNEAYRVTVSIGGTRQSWLTSEPSLGLGPEVLAAWRAIGPSVPVMPSVPVVPSVSVAVTQVGERGESIPLTGQIAIAA